MKIIIIARGYPSKSDPQWGCFERDQAIALHNLGHEVSVMSVERGVNTYKGDFKVTSRIIDGMQVCNDRSWIPESALESISTRLSKIYFERKFLKLFDLMVAKVGLPDVVFVHYLGNMEYLRLIKDKYGIPIVGMEHWSRINTDVISPKLFQKGKTAYSNVDKLITVSCSLQDKVRKFWNIDSVVVNNMVGTEFSYIERDKRESFQFVSCGQLIKRKGFDILIDAFYNSSLRNTDTRIVIIGEGKERSKLQNLIDKYELTNQIILVGKKTKSEILQILFQSDAFVLASRAETFGVVYIESMMTGLPVIGTICGGPEEFINGDNGILVQVDDVKGLQQALETMYNNIDSYNGHQISLDCQNRFSPNIIATKLTGLFEEVIKEYRK